MRVNISLNDKSMDQLREMRRGDPTVNLSEITRKAIDREYRRRYRTWSTIQKRPTIVGPIQIR